MKGRLGIVIVLLICVFPLFVRAEYESFAIVSDSHIGLSSTIYTNVIGILEGENIRTVIHTGDAIHNYGNSKQWKRFLEITGKDKTLHLAPGNHDIRSKKSYETYLKFFPAPYYSFSEGETLFILLNTALPGEEHKIAGEQFKWLKSELQRSFRHKFVFLHEPPYPVIPLHGLDRYRTERDALHKLFVDNGVSLVVAGHDHYYKRMLKDEIAYIVMGATGGRLGLLEKNGDFFCYMMVERTDQGYSFVVRDLRGNVRDRFSIGDDGQFLFIDSGQKRLSLLSILGISCPRAPKQLHP